MWGKERKEEDGSDTGRRPGGEESMRSGKVQNLVTQCPLAFSQALEAIEKALQLKPKDPKVISELFFTKGNQLREQNLLDKAFEV